MVQARSKHLLRPWQWVAIIIASIVLIMAVGFAGYFLYSAANSLPANSAALNSAQQDTSIQIVDKGSYYALLPKQATTTGIIIYPGAFAEPKGYIPRYAELAKEGIAVFIIRSPFNFALFDVNRADRIMRENTSISNWYVAGHSLGGVAACDYAKTHQAKLSGLILLASYCNGSATNLTIPVLSISASRDGLATQQKITESKKNLPGSTQFVVVEGGNHTLFGSFAKNQSGDNPAGISEKSAEQQIITAISGFITLKLL